MEAVDEISRRVRAIATAWDEYDSGR